MADLIERSEALRVIGEYDDRGLALWQVQRITDGCKEAVAALPCTTYSQLSKALCGKENVTADEMLRAVEQLKRRAEPENRVLTLEEIDEMANKEDWEFAWVEYQHMPGFLMQGCPYSANEARVCFLEPGTEDEIFYDADDYNKTWRRWLRKPTPEQMAAEKWEE